MNSLMINHEITQHNQNAARQRLARVLDKIAPDRAMNLRTARLLAAIQRHPQPFRQKFPGWLEKNRLLFDLFELAALRMRDAGRESLSARKIADRIRRQGRPLNNDFVPDMARLYNALHSEQNLFTLQRR